MKRSMNIKLTLLFLQNVVCVYIHKYVLYIKCFHIKCFFSKVHIKCFFLQTIFSASYPRTSPTCVLFYVCHHPLQLVFIFRTTWYSLRRKGAVHVAVHNKHAVHVAHSLQEIQLLASVATASPQSEIKLSTNSCRKMNNIQQPPIH